MASLPTQSPSQRNRTTASTPSSSSGRTSFLRRWTQEASNVISDMYGNLVLGDDVGGESERIAVVLQPRPMKNAAGLRSSSSSLRRYRPVSAQHPVHTAGGTVPSLHNTHAQAVDPNLGQSSHANRPSLAKPLTPIQQQQQLALMMMMMQSSNLLHLEETMGMTLVEINGRSYVHSVVPGGQASQAGVHVQDCIQYAAIIETPSHNDPDTQPSANADSPPVLSDAIQQQIRKQATDKEKEGSRIPHDELVRLIQGNLYQATQNPPQHGSSQHNPVSPFAGSVPLTINVVGKKNGQRGTADGSSGVTTQADLGSPTTSQTPPNPMVFVLLRTCQRRSTRTASSLTVDIPTPSGATSSSIHTDPFSPPIAPTTPNQTLSPFHWRMDDECDAAAILIRSLIPSDRDRNGCLTDTMDCGSSSPKPSPASDLTIIRTHISRAVGIAIVRASKIGMGLSVHGGSGIVLARLSDGTWSAPSAIAVWGMGIGVSVGMEMAQYLLVLPTQESLSHFIRGGSFTVGGTVGASWAGHGKESYGAASVSGSGAPVLCGSYDNTVPSAPPGVVPPLANGAVGTITGTHMNASASYHKSSNSIGKYGGGGTNVPGHGGGNTVISGNGGYNPTAEDEYYHDPDSAKSGATTHSTVADSDTSTDEALRDANAGINFCNSAGAAAAVSPSGATSRTSGICPLLAYTVQAQGFFVGASLEGSRVLCRSDMNQRAYKFATLGQSVSAHDILTGKVATPPQAEPLYAALHALELAHEVSRIKPPPALLTKVRQDWMDTSMTLRGTNDASTSIPSSTKDGMPPVGAFWTTLTPDETKECIDFERQAKRFLYGGVSVQRIILPPGTTSSLILPSISTVRRERRTLWLMLPEAGSLRLGFVSKVPDENIAAAAAAASDLIDGGKRSTSSVTSAVNSFLKNPLNRWQQYQQDHDSVTIDDEVTLDSALLEKNDSTFVMGQVRTGNVELSSRYSVALTDVTLVSQSPSKVFNLPSDIVEDFKAWDDCRRMVMVRDCIGTTLLFLTNTPREAEIIVCGLKLLLERETSRIGVRGGNALSRIKGCAPPVQSMSPSAARGGMSSSSDSRTEGTSPSLHPANTSSRTGRRNSGASSRSSSSSVGDEVREEVLLGEATLPSHSAVPEGWGSWGRVPGRNYMRGQASSTELVPGDASSPRAALEKGVPKYVHGQLLVRDVEKNVHLPLPLPLCRVLLLDSTSPVISKWEQERGDIGFETTPWTFPPATPREMEHHSSEHQLIASGSMCGAHRTVSFERSRNGGYVRLAEMWKVDSDDSEKMAFTVTERMPRRGFSLKVKVVLRSFTSHSCEATVLGELRPVGKNMANQAAVHKAFLMVLDELKARYGLEDAGLLGGFLDVVNSMPADSKAFSGAETAHGSVAGASRPIPRPFQRTTPTLHEEKKDGDDTKEVNGKDFADAPPQKSPSKSALPTSDSKDNKSVLVSFEEMMKTDKIPDDSPDKIRGPIDRFRPSGHNPKLHRSGAEQAERIRAKRQHIKSDTFDVLEDVDEEHEDDEKREHRMIEVKPLPKVRLCLMPAPREEDEYKADEDSNEAAAKNTKKSRRKRTSKKSSTASPSVSSPSGTPSPASSKRSTGSSWKKSPRARKI